MPETRNLFIIALAVLGFMIWTQWQQDYSPRSVVEPTDGNVVSGQSVDAATEINNDVPATLPAVSNAEDVPTVSNDLPLTGSEQPPQQLIRVQTDVLDVLIDTQGGNLVSVKLLEYPVDHDEPEIPVELLKNSNGEFYVAQSGLLSAEQPAPTHRSDYRSDSREYTLSGSADELVVPLSWSENGIRVEKRLIFTRGSYTIGNEFELSNQSSTTWQGNRYAQLQRTEPADTGGGFTDTSRYSFNGAAYYTPEENFTKLKFSKFNKQPLQTNAENGWIAMIQHYFMSAWIPPADSTEILQSQVAGSVNTPRYLLRMQSQPVNVASGSSYTFSNQLYVGPKLQDRLTDLAPGLELTVDYGIFTIFSKPLFWALDKIHLVVGNWGWAIVILTILIKLAFFKLTEAQYRSMARMRKLQPRMEKLKERYGDDRQKMSQAMMEMYKTEKVNPLGGCLPILIQIPIFIALYWVLLESVELRQAPFVAWIQDLSSPDPYFILPLINGLAMIATQRMTPTPGMDPLQRKMMQALPVVFSIMFAFFPAGLVLYWATNATISFAQQWFITRRIERSAS